jgi:hypothetical protein
VRKTRHLKTRRRMNWARGRMDPTSFAETWERKIQLDGRRGRGTRKSLFMVGASHLFGEELLHEERLAKLGKKSRCRLFTEDLMSPQTVVSPWPARVFLNE